jgi:hypothetical protein
MIQHLLTSEDEPLEAKWDPHWMRLVLVRRRSVVILTIENSGTYSIIQHLRREDIFPRGAKILVGAPPVVDSRTHRNNPAATLHLEKGGKAAFRWWRTKAGIQAGSQSDSVKFMQGNDRSSKLFKLASESIEIQPPGICWWDMAFLHPLRGWESAYAHPDVPVYFRGKNGLNPWDLFPHENSKPVLLRTSFVPLSGYEALERYPLVMAILHTGEGRWWRRVRRHDKLISGLGLPFGNWHNVWGMPDGSQIDLKIHPLGLGAWVHTGQEVQWFSPTMQSHCRHASTEFVSWTRLGGLVYRFQNKDQKDHVLLRRDLGYLYDFGSVFWAGESAFGHFLEITREGRINCVAGEMLTCRQSEIDPDGVGMPV